MFKKKLLVVLSSIALQFISNAQNDTLFYNSFDEYKKLISYDEDFYYSKEFNQNLLDFDQFENISKIAYRVYLSCDLIKGMYIQVSGDRTTFNFSQQKNLKLIRDYLWEQDFELSDEFVKLNVTYLKLIENHNIFNKQNNRIFLRNNKAQIQELHDGITNLINNPKIKGYHPIIWAHYILGMEYDILRIEKSANKLNKDLIESRIEWYKTVFQKDPLFSDLQINTKQNRDLVANRRYETRNFCETTGGRGGRVYYYKFYSENSLNDENLKKIYQFLKSQNFDKFEIINNKLTKLEIFDWNKQNCCIRGRERICGTLRWNDPRMLASYYHVIEESRYNLKNVQKDYDNLNSYLGIYYLIDFEHNFELNKLMELNSL